MSISILGRQLVVVPCTPVPQRAVTPIIYETKLSYPNYHQKKTSIVFCSSQFQDLPILLTAHNDTFFPFPELDNSVEIQEGRRIYPTHLERLKKLLGSDSLCHIPRDSVFVCSFFPATQPSPRKSHYCPNKLFSLISVDYCSYTMTTTRVFPTFFSSQWKESAGETSNTCKMTTLLLKKAEAGLRIRGL